MKEFLQRIIDNMQGEINFFDKYKPGNEYNQGYVDCCNNYIDDLKELKEMLEKGK